MDEQPVRRALTFGPLVACAGIVWTAVTGAKGEPTTLASLVVLAGLGACIWGTHHFGRLGPDDPGAGREEPAPAPPPKKRRTRRKSQPAAADDADR